MDESTGKLLAGVTVQDVVKVAAVFVTAAGMTFQLWPMLLKELRGIKNAEASVGAFGIWFWIIHRFPLLLGQFFLIASICITIAAIIGGANYGKPLLPTQRFLTLCNYFYNYVFEIIALYLLGATVVHFKALERLFLGIALLCSQCVPALRYNCGLINAHLLLTCGEASKLVNVSKTRCGVAANFVLQVPTSISRADYAGDFCANPKWPAANRANALLIGCIIEGIIHDFPASAPLKVLDFSILYGRLGSHEAEALWDESCLRFESEAVRRILDFLRLERSNGLARLVEEQLVVAAIKETVRILARDFYGDASTLAWGPLSAAPSRKLVEKRLGQFPKMKKGEQNAMNDLFFKLAVSARVWPAIDPGLFKYQFSRNTAMFMMNAGCLMTFGDNNSLIMEKHFRKLLAAAEHAVVNACGVILKGNDSSRAALELDAGYRDWDLSREVDYSLWWLARQSGGWKLNLAELLPGAAVERPLWQIDGNSLVRN